MKGYLIRKILRRSPKRCECRHGLFEEARDATRRITSPTQLDSSLAWLATMMPGIDLLGSGEGRVEQGRECSQLSEVFLSGLFRLHVILRIIWHTFLRDIWHKCQGLQKEREILPQRSTCEGYQKSSQSCYFENIISRMVFEKHKSLNLEIW
jgi:hypothetical protein